MGMPMNSTGKDMGSLAFQEGLILPLTINTILVTRRRQALLGVLRLPGLVLRHYLYLPLHPSYPITYHARLCPALNRRQTLLLLFRPQIQPLLYFTVLSLRYRTTISRRGGSWAVCPR